VRPGKKEKRSRRTTSPPLATELFRRGSRAVEEKPRVVCPEKLSLATTLAYHDARSTVAIATNEQEQRRNAYQPSSDLFPFRVFFNHQRGSFRIAPSAVRE
jgi:hypothetical protein